MQRRQNIFLITIFFLLLTGWACSEKTIAPTEDLTRWVDPFIGTGFHGHVFLGANIPFGAVQLGPVNRTEGWDWCSGYHISDSTIIGFSHTRLSGTGIGDLGDVLVMPFTGTTQPRKGAPGKDEEGYYSLFSHANETARPGYYAVKLDRYKIDAELTATDRVGFHRYRFPDADTAKLIMDLREGVGWDLATETHIEWINDSTLSGYRYSTGWARDQRIWFTAVFSEPIGSVQLYDSSVAQPGDQYTGRFAKAILSFRPLSGKPMMLKLGISPVSAENAMDNIRQEIPAWDFDETRQRATARWNQELSKIKVTSRDTATLRNFYTALYHTMMAPALFNDHNGDYRGTDRKVYAKAGFDNYTVFSLWDTYRAANPLYTLIQQERVPHLMQSMLAIAEQQGKLPVWHLVGNETNTMPGNSATQVLADAWLKGLAGTDAERVWRALSQTAMGDERGLNFVKKLGYIPADSMVESAAMGLEYAIADDAMAQVAAQMGKKEEYAYYLKRSRNYQNYFDSSIGFVRGRVSAGQWRTPFSPFEARHMKDDFCEGNAWQYTWLVPQDVEGLISKLGGEEAFIAKLDSLFVADGEMGEHASADITGLIGQYAHGNEPSHHIAYLYTYAGQPSKTAERIRQILTNMYADRPDGLSGNEDAGQMSAWYILSSIGLYQVQPAGGLFVIGSPIMDDVRIQLGKGKEVHIAVTDNSPSHPYVQEVSWNGKPWTRSYITYEELQKGGEMTIRMGATPSSWGRAVENRPYSILNRPN